MYYQYQIVVVLVVVVFILDKIVRFDKIRSVNLFFSLKQYCCYYTSADTLPETLVHPVFRSLSVICNLLLQIQFSTTLAAVLCKFIVLVSFNTVFAILRI